jgi:hypothetical protein
MAAPERGGPGARGRRLSSPAQEAIPISARFRQSLASRLLALRVSVAGTECAVLGNCGGCTA